MKKELYTCESVTMDAKRRVVLTADCHGYLEIFLVKSLTGANRLKIVIEIPDQAATIAVDVKKNSGARDPYHAPECTCPYHPYIFVR
jgi:hypothetical protein